MARADPRMASDDWVGAMCKRDATELISVGSHNLARGRDPKKRLEGSRGNGVVKAGGKRGQLAFCRLPLEFPCQLGAP